MASNEKSRGSVDPFLGAINPDMDMGDPRDTQGLDSSDLQMVGEDTRVNAEDTASDDPRSEVVVKTTKWLVEHHTDAFLGGRRASNPQDVLDDARRTRGGRGGTNNRSGL